MGTVASPVWAQELEVHWPKNWRLLQARSALLEEFDPTVFTFQEKGAFWRIADHHDVRLSQFGVHFRILAGKPDMKCIEHALSRVLFHMAPRQLMDARATFALVAPLVGDYDEVRKRTAKPLLGSWAASKQIHDYSIWYGAKGPQDEECKVLFGIASKDELIDGLAEAVSTETQYLRERTPPWMKVRLPEVALFMKYNVNLVSALGEDAGSNDLVSTWTSWQRMATEEYAEVRSLVDSLVGDLT